ncbi:MAG: VanZ family protein [Rhodospirillaceae bacterium]
MPRLTGILCASWALGIAILSLLPAETAISTGGYDKLEHGTAFAVLAILMRLTWPKPHVFLIFLVCTLYGALIEAGQAFSPGRHPDLWDLFADALGATLGLILIRYWPTRRRH